MTGLAVPADVRALLRFHLRVGARLAMRTMAPAAAMAVGAMVVVADGFPLAFVRMLFGDAASGNLRPLLALPCLAFAAAAGPRVGRGLDGWLRHLPASGVTQRRAAALAVAVAELPLLAGLAFLAALVFHGWPALVADLAGLIVCMLASSLAVAPVEHPARARPLALLAAVLAVSGRGAAIAAALALVAAADASAGSRPRPRARRTRGWRPATAPFELAVRMAWRALGTRVFTAAWGGLLPLGAVALFLANNTLTALQAGLAVRLGGGAALVLACANIAEPLAARRPAWPWSRSLPWSAARRVIFDACLIAVPALALVAITARLDSGAALPLAAIVPLVAFRSAGAMRRAPERGMGAAGEIALQGGLLAAAVAAWPWLALGALALVPWAIRDAARREAAQKVSRWLERHHLSAGDPLSWSA